MWRLTQKNFHGTLLSGYSPRITCADMPDVWSIRPTSWPEVPPSCQQTAITKDGRRSNRTDQYIGSAIPSECVNIFDDEMEIVILTKHVWSLVLQPVSEYFLSYIYSWSFKSDKSINIYGIEYLTLKGISVLFTHSNLSIISQICWTKIYNWFKLWDHKNMHTFSKANIITNS